MKPRSRLRGFEVGLDGIDASVLAEGYPGLLISFAFPLPGIRLCHGNERRIERGQGLIRSHAAATASTHCAAASALKIRSVDREMRWR
jgi:hypothetical protein